MNPEIPGEMWTHVRNLLVFVPEGRAGVNQNIRAEFARVCDENVCRGKLKRTCGTRKHGWGMAEAWQLWVRVIGGKRNTLAVVKWGQAWRKWGKA